MRLADSGATKQVLFDALIRMLSQPVPWSVLCSLFSRSLMAFAITGSEQHAVMAVMVAVTLLVQLSMTRALGHNMLADFGVIPTPTVVQRELRPEDACLVVASDGDCPLALMLVFVWCIAPIGLLHVTPAASNCIIP